VVNALEDKSKSNEPEMTSEGKYRCKKDKQEFNTQKDFETHCKEEHTM